MSVIVIKKDEPEGPKWDIGAQVQKHDLSSVQVGFDGRAIVQSVDPRRRIIGTNQWGMPEGLFVYGRDRSVQQECYVDIDVAPEHDRLNGTTRVKVLGVHIMCPRCWQPLYIRSPDSPAGAGRPAHQIEVHWSNIRPCKDGYWRPTFSVGAPFRCENAWRTSKRANPDTAGLCNWRGGILNGLCLDHWS